MCYEFLFKRRNRDAVCTYMCTHCHVLKDRDLERYGPISSVKAADHFQGIEEEKKTKGISAHMVSELAVGVGGLQNPFTRDSIGTTLEKIDESLFILTGF
ncbi:hypothetical protein Aduo_019209 [Ancylostoma duodenale]